MKLRGHRNIKEKLPIIISFTILFAFGLSMNLLISNKVHDPRGRNVDKSFTDQRMIQASENNPVKHFQNFDQYLQFTHISHHPNIPKILLTAPKISSYMPNLGSILWTGSVWQETDENLPKFLLYSAHRDYRGLKKDERVNIRILALYKGTDPVKKYSCYIWLNSKKLPFVSPVYKFELLGENFSNSTFYPYLITCRIPTSLRTRTPPFAVSIVRKPNSRANNILQVTGSEKAYQESRTKNLNIFKLDKENLKIGICLPSIDLYHLDYSTRFVEWAELLVEMGVTKLYCYRSRVHPNLEKVLLHYEKKRLLKILDFNYPPPKLDYPALRHLWTDDKGPDLKALEKIYQTDCILRHKDEIDFVLHLDPDEMPVLHEHKTFQQFITHILRGNQDNMASLHLLSKTFYAIENSNGTSSTERFLYILQRNHYMKTLYDGERVTPGKFIYNTKYVLAADTNSPLLFVGESDKKIYNVPAQVAQIGDYRNKCTEKICREEGQLKKEDAFLKYEKSIIAKVKKLLRELNISTH